MCHVELFFIKFFTGVLSESPALVVSNFIRPLTEKSLFTTL
ncbi:hypothetical protein HMPREF9554_01371 [Treponema phagedenis F0421]|nr:hypothetical protein HMPREF9554_01371 [Treponema phagedenis F0421]